MMRKKIVGEADGEDVFDRVFGSEEQPERITWTDVAREQKEENNLKR